MKLSDHCYTIKDSPRQLKRRCDELKENLDSTKKALNNAQHREARAKRTLSTLLTEVEKEKLIASEARQMLKSFENLPMQLFTKNTGAYNDEQRQFATTLHYYSPKAYEYCRKRLPLPAPSTLRRWLSTIDSRPGFSEQVFSFLKDKVQGENSWQYKSCSVMIDGMSIRKHIDWDPVQQKMIGFTDLGAGSLDSDSQQEATEALVIMAVGLTGHWKVTLGYFLIAGINATVQAQLVRTAFCKLHEVGMRGMALIMDGHATNQAMVHELGSRLTPGQLTSYFDHPMESAWRIFISFDACHMLKLLRNALEAMGVIVLPGIGIARWSDIAKVHELQQKEGLRAANKLTEAHIHFQQQKMNVQLAAQTLSASVGTALRFLSSNKIEGFSDTTGTQKFVFTVDRLFDTLNSRTPKASGYKQALTIETFRKVIPFLRESRQLLLSMTDSQGKRLCESRRHMAHGCPGLCRQHQQSAVAGQ